MFKLTDTYPPENEGVYDDVKAVRVWLNELTVEMDGEEYVIDRQKISYYSEVRDIGDIGQLVCDSEALRKT